MPTNVQFGPFNFQINSDDLNPIVGTLQLNYTLNDDQSISAASFTYTPPSGQGSAQTVGLTFTGPDGGGFYTGAPNANPMNPAWVIPGSDGGSFTTATFAFAPRPLAPNLAILTGEATTADGNTAITFEADPAVPTTQFGPFDFQINSNAARPITGKLQLNYGMDGTTIGSASFTYTFQNNSFHQPLTATAQTPDGVYTLLPTTQPMTPPWVVPGQGGGSFGFAEFTFAPNAVPPTLTGRAFTRQGTVAGDDTIVFEADASVPEEIALASKTAYPTE